MDKVKTKKDAKLESKMTELKSRIDLLEKEKEDLLDQLRTSDRKHSEMRVKLIKQMKQDADTFRKFKIKKEKEVNQLKTLERKRVVEISKLQEGNNRQEAVLKRKNEEISRIQKQLRETQEKQKIVAEKRQQTFDRKDNSSLGDKLRSWITHKLELTVSLLMIEDDQENRVEHLFNNIHSLLEARVLLKHLFNSGVQYLLDAKLKQNQFEAQNNSLIQELNEVRKKLEKIEDENRTCQRTFNNDKSELIQHYEQRYNSTTIDDNQSQSLSNFNNNNNDTNSDINTSKIKKNSEISKLLKITFLKIKELENKKKIYKFDLNAKEKKY